MRISKNLQYGLLFVLYLDRAGRATTEGAAASLSLSVPFLHQVARKLRKAGVIKSIRGPNGGYEILDEPTVMDVFNALSPLALLKPEESSRYRNGGSEQRSLHRCIMNISHSIRPLLNQTVKRVGTDLVANELLTLDTAAITAQAN